MEPSVESIEPAYEFGKPNESIVLSREAATIDIDGKCCSCEAEVRLILIPRSGVEIRLRCDQPPFQFDPYPKLGSLRFEQTAAVVPGFTKLPMFPGSPAEIHWAPSSEPFTAIASDSVEVSHVVYHLFNFKHISGTRRTTKLIGAGAVAIAHVELVTSEWHVELQSEVDPGFWTVR